MVGDGEIHAPSLRRYDPVQVQRVRLRISAFGPFQENDPGHPEVRRSIGKWPAGARGVWRSRGCPRVDRFTPYRFQGLAGYHLPFGKVCAVQGCRPQKNDRHNAGHFPSCLLLHNHTLVTPQRDTGRRLTVTHDDQGTNHRHSHTTLTTNRQTCNQHQLALSEVGRLAVQSGSNKVQRFFSNHQNGSDPSQR